MPALFVFLLKVNIALLLFCAGYYLVLRHLTFYTLNRIYLVAAILFASVYPKINLDGFAQRHQQLTQPVQVVILNLQAPAETLVKPLAQPVYWQWAEIVFFAGAAFLAIRLLMQLFSLYKLHRSSIPMKIREHEVRIMHGNAGPFSFWKSIYVNPANHDATDLKAILQHEQVHVNEWHTLDILLAELSTIFYWFNPGVWLMKRAVRENIEFITDRKILQKGIDSKKYQYSLLNVSFATKQPGIANHFNISTLKKRIIMMNAKRSSQVNLTRYAFLIPALLICLFAFSFSKAELIKKSNSTYKAITLSVATITNMASEKLDVKAVSNLFKKRDTIKRKKMLFDTIRIVQGVKINDTGKLKTIVTYNYLISTDTNHITKIRLNGRNMNPDSNHIVTARLNGRSIGHDSVIYVVNGVRATGIKAIKAEDIKNVNVRRGSPANPTEIIITTNTNDEPGAPNITVTPDGNAEALLNRMRGIRVSSTGVVTHDTLDYKKTVYLKQHLEDENNTLSKKMQDIKVMGFRSNESSIDHLSNKLTIIDGKEASAHDLKKLRASDIESMNVKRGEVILKQYGDKAKNGVLFITTTKAK